MGNKTEQYWSEINDMASEGVRLSIEVQGPLIEKYIDDDDILEMDIDEIVEVVRDHYSEDDHKAWGKLEARGARLAIQFHISPDEVLQDVWMIINQTPHPTKTIPYH